MEGWIKLHRQFIEWEWFDDSDTVKVFLFLLLSANHKDGKWKGIEVKRGQLITGLNSLSEKLGMSIKIIRNRLEKLEKTGEIGRETGNQYSVITICNYDSYQSIDDSKGKQTGSQGANEGQTEGNQRATNKNVKNENTVNNDKKFTPPSLEEIISYCKERDNKVDPQRFIDFYEAKGWMIGKNKIKNWKAAVRTWEKGDEKQIDRNQESKHYARNTSDFSEYGKD